jgi:cation:H+ antiporter
LVLVIADRFVRGDRPLSTAAGSLVPALEGLLVIAVVCLTAMSAVLPSSANIGPLGVGAIGIVVIWVIGIATLNRARTRSDLALVAVGGGSPPSAVSTAGEGALAAGASEGSGGGGRPILLFAVASIVTLVAGVVLERTGNQLANNWGMNGVLFGATFLAAATALPEISTGITGVRLARYTLVFGDMFGGNAFQLTLFLVADLVAGQPVLPAEGKANAWIGCIGLLMTAAFVSGIVLRPSTATSASASTRGSPCSSMPSASGAWSSCRADHPRPPGRRPSGATMSDAPTSDRARRRRLRARLDPAPCSDTCPS